MGFVKMLFRCSARAAAGKVCLPIKHECNKDSRCSLTKMGSATDTNMSRFQFHPDREDFWRKSSWIFEIQERRHHNF
ncbi:hypothetical protein F444_22738 [Phytophthora nicotianae P1976]|uniref:Uncharacterized protein n=1 Tax=Phytophthora nicotianae P1976 TaxID=1317066 RepID=A0A080YWX3_PHYNI|nr:hypothetical protein F444_22738 [Phytophthora nicotianae P1976]